MARGQAKFNAKNNRQQSQVLQNQDKVLKVRTTYLSSSSVEKQFRVIKNRVVIRKDAHLQTIENLNKQLTSQSNYIRETQIFLSSSINNVLIDRKVSFSSILLLRYHDIHTFFTAPLSS